MIAFEAYKNCSLCPRQCGIDRTAGHTGICGETADLRIASIGPHFGEEPPISGRQGSGTVFFSGCSLRCRFCQNYDISHCHMGQVMSIDRIADFLFALWKNQKVHNINFVTPDHFLPHTLLLTEQLREKGVSIPVLYNTSGYMKVEVLVDLQDHADIYMPDFKFADPDLAKRQANAPDYPHIALAAIQEMVRQKDFLDVNLNERVAAQHGVFVRHLVLPGYIDNSIQALDLLVRTFGQELPVNIMSQFWPARQQKDQRLNRRLYDHEYAEVLSHAEALGFQNLLLQPL